MNDLYLTDEEIWGKEPTWEEQEIDRLKKKIEQLEDRLEDKECIIKMAKEYLHNYSIDNSFSFPLMPKWEERQIKSCIEYEFNDTLKKRLLNILEVKNEFKN